MARVLIMAVATMSTMAAMSIVLGVHLVAGLSTVIAVVMVRGMFLVMVLVVVTVWGTHFPSFIRSIRVMRTMRA